MDSTKEAFAELGSLDAFVQRSGIDSEQPEALTAYTDALIQKRQKVAQSIGITPEGLRIITSN